MNAPAEPLTKRRNMVGYIDQAMCAGGEMLARDQASPARVRDLRVLFVDVVQALEDDPAPPGVIEDLMDADARIQCLER